jgi:hypothetical protein
MLNKKPKQALRNFPIWLSANVSLYAGRKTLLRKEADITLLKDSITFDSIK